MGDNVGWSTSQRTFEFEGRPGEEWVLRFRRPVPLLLGETRRQTYGARKESLLALWSLTDHAVESVVEREKTERQGRTKIKIE